MTTTTTVIKYGLADTAGVVGQNPFKAKARFDSLSKWAFTDKLNQLMEFTFTVPNDEFHRANALEERKVFVPFINPFRGLITSKSINESSITLKAKEFATHLERRIYTHDDTKRVVYTKENWFNGEWKHRTKIIIPKELVVDTIRALPILCNFGPKDSFKNNAQADGDDFVFTEKDGKTICPHEIEKYDNTTGELVAWVKTPKVIDSGEFVMYVYYDNVNVTSQQDVVNTWKELYSAETATAITTFSYDAVWHLHADSLDSTENNNDGTDTSITRAAAQIADGAVMDSADSKIDVGTGTTLDDTFDNNGWITAWINPNSDGETNIGAILNKVTWSLRVQDEASGFVRIRFLHTFTGADGEWDTAVDIPLNELTRIDVVYDNSAVGNDPTIYINGDPRTIANGLLTETTTPTSTRDSDAASNLIIGNITSQGNTFDGEIDEVRLMKVIPADIDHIIKTHYNNESQPTVFVSAFPQEQYVAKASVVIQQILDSANTDMPSGVVWILDEEVPGLITVNGLVTSIDFEDNVRDQVGSNDGTITGVDSYEDGKLGKAGNFGITKIIRVALANESNFDVTDSQQMGFSFWFKTPASAPASAETIVAKGDDPAASVGVYFTLGTDLKLTFRIRNSAPVNFDAVSSILKVDTFYNVIATYDGAGNMELFLNNVADGTQTGVTGTITNNVAMTIGSDSDGSNGFTGLIDEFDFYKDVLLSAADRLKLLNKGNSGIETEMRFKNHFESLHIVGEILGDDIWFDNKEYRVFVGTKGKTLDPKQKLDLIITSNPQTSTEDFANEINIIGKKDSSTDKQMETNVVTDTVLRFNYERVLSDNQLSSDDQIESVGNNLLKEFQKLTPQVKGEIPYNQFIRLDLGTGDVIKIAQPQKQLNSTFRVMDIKSNVSKAKVSLESTETGTIRLRSLSFTDIVGGIIKRLEEQSIES